MRAFYVYQVLCNLPTIFLHFSLEILCLEMYFLWSSYVIKLFKTDFAIGVVLLIYSVLIVPWCRYAHIIHACNCSNTSTNPLHHTHTHAYKTTRASESLGQVCRHSHVYTHTNLQCSKTKSVACHVLALRCYRWCYSSPHSQ